LCADVSLQVARTITISVFYPLLCTGRIGYAMNWRTALVMIWAGLRGAVSINAVQQGCAGDS
jgi:NhaP-type Na+/H+ or K+/H+ antiporter